MFCSFSSIVLLLLTVCSNWGPPEDDDQADSSNMPKNCRTATRENTGALGVVSWWDAKSLKNALCQRRLHEPRMTLQPEELKIARQLNDHILQTNGGVSKVIFPPARSERESMILYVKPARSRSENAKTTTKKIVDLVEDICLGCNVNLAKLLEALGKRREQNLHHVTKESKENVLMEQTIALMNFAGLSDNAYHKIRLYAKKVWDIDFGVSLKYLNRYLQIIIPSDDVCTKTKSLQVGSTESSSDKKYQDCTYFFIKRPWDLVAN
jgi:hypothetical protein